jgi:hypothetical protein
VVAVVGVPTAEPPLVCVVVVTVVVWQLTLTVPLKLDEHEPALTQPVSEIRLQVVVVQLFAALAVAAVQLCTFVGPALFGLHVVVVQLFPADATEAVQL